MNTNQYIDNVVLKEIKESNFLNIRKDAMALYAIRINNSYSGKDCIKVGETRIKSTKETCTQLLERIYSLNISLECERRIKLLFFGFVSNINSEKEIHSQLNIFSCNDIITNPLKSKPKELYHISSAFYDMLKYYFSFHTNNIFFESQKYKILDNSDEYIMIDDETEIDQFEENDFDYLDDDETDKFIALNHHEYGKKYGEKYWKVQHELYGNYKIDDGEEDTSDNFDKDDDFDNDDFDENYNPIDIEYEMDVDDN